MYDYSKDFECYDYLSEEMQREIAQSEVPQIDDVGIALNITNGIVTSASISIMYTDGVAWGLVKGIGFDGEKLVFVNSEGLREVLFRAGDYSTSLYRQFVAYLEERINVLYEVKYPLCSVIEIFD